MERRLREGVTPPVRCSLAQRLSVDVSKANPAVEVLILHSTSCNGVVGLPYSLRSQHQRLPTLKSAKCRSSNGRASLSSNTRICVERDNDLRVESRPMRSLAPRICPRFLAQATYALVGGKVLTQAQRCGHRAVIDDDYQVRQRMKQAVH